ncbi:ferrous iron transport protein b c terminus [Lucifera butyrica]|uniref:Ferrous iron transport protein B n=1 Tax=Lucifera butyrica TaxID=1351585 RepID=A0A498R8F6_9FIRM|nr:ferrous iron transport protein B [Lucifera butyrica]VBB07671.1 ferrous iron transport protein b c terminus [Lucifera butyrica]
MTTSRLTLALAGNPNSGKTTIFNSITGARQHVGNYPGVTVEKRQGMRHYAGKNLLVVDLPGTYSLTAHSLDEIVACNFIVEEQPDILVNILDSSNLERNLYLAVQLLELEKPVVFALNMTDVAESMGLKIDDRKLEQKLGSVIVRTVGNRSRGIDALIKTVVDVAERKKKQSFTLNYDPEIENKINKLSELLSMTPGLAYPVRWLAVKLLENDENIKRQVTRVSENTAAITLAETLRAEYKAATENNIEFAIAECRYRAVSEIYQDCVASRGDHYQTVSDKIDNILTHRLLGLPIFLGIMWLLFNIVFTVGAYPQGWLEDGINQLGQLISHSMPASDLKSLIIDGIIGGVGSVVSFLPLILLLFLGIALLEDSGYMARAAFVMDRIMRAVGLHGKSFIPLLLGFGCSVPAIMGTRTLENPRDRMVTILVTPLMSCSARLPVYTLLIAAFFSQAAAGSVLFSIYLLGIIMAIIMAFLFRKTLFSGASEPFVMEMPPYHLPTLRSVFMHMWERSVLYLKKAGTIILAVSILIWFLTNYPNDVSYSKNYEQAKAQIEQTVNTQLELEQPQKEELNQLDAEQAGEKLANSYAGRFGHFIEPLIKPLGFNWKMGVGLFAGFAAKEVVVSTMGTIYSSGSAEDDSSALQNALAADPSFSPLVAYTLMVFVLLYTPCIAAISVIKRETNSWKWMTFSMVYSTALAWIVSFLVYHAGLLLGY